MNEPAVFRMVSTFGWVLLLPFVRLQGSLRGHWAAFSQTAPGDIFATGLAIMALFLLFAVCGFALIALVRRCSFLFGLMD